MLKILKATAICIVAICLTLFVIGRCSTLPSLEGRTTSTVLLDTADTRLGKSVTPLLEVHPGLSGVYLLPDSRDAFAARARLAEVAERTLDVQYYIWENDMTGTLLFEALHAAADRGVRVRLLLDDNTTQGLDPILAATWESEGGSPPPPGSTGLYHLAIVYPTRAQFADALRRVLRAGIRLEGASDHGVSEAIYLRDPDGNGLELYWDRPKQEWPRKPNGDLAMVTEASRFGSAPTRSGITNSSQTSYHHPL